MKYNFTIFSHHIPLNFDNSLPHFVMWKIDKCVCCAVLLKLNNTCLLIPNNNLNFLFELVHYMSKYLFLYN